jgi:hypothetical protein
MIFQLLKLSVNGYPNRPGIRVVKVAITYFGLAIRNLGNVQKLAFPEVVNQSDVWASYSKWLRFQLKYINKKDWARTPLIRDVSLVHTEPLFGKDFCMNRDDKNTILTCAEKLAQEFRGIPKEKFSNWLERYLILMQSFKELNVSPIEDEIVICEIGPGFGPVMALTSKKKMKYLSFDTFEMQEVNRHVIESITSSPTNYEYHPTNLDDSKTPLNAHHLPYCVIAIYSLTELEKSEREMFLNLVKKAEYSLIACNENFNGLNNFAYIENLAESLNLSFTFKTMESIYGDAIPRYTKKHRLYLVGPKLKNPLID